MKVAHISDLHISGKHKPWNIDLFKRTLSYLSSIEIDHLVITGDISDNLDEKDFLLVRRLLDAFNFLDANKCSIVIGNHDIFGGPQTAQDVINFPGKCLSTNYNEKIDNFVKHFKELFEGTLRPIEGESFPYAKCLKDYVFVGLNTIAKYSRLKNPFASNGHVSKQHKDALQNIFEKFNEKKKIILSHHHFYKNRIPAKSSESALWNRIEDFTMKLRGKKKLLNLFGEYGVKLILHGHSHEMREYDRKGIKVINAGGTFEEESNLIKLFIINLDSVEPIVNQIILEESLEKIAI